MRIRLALTLDVERRRPPQGEPERESEANSLVELADPHPEVERPIGFRRS